MSGEGTTLWAVRAGGTGGDRLGNVAVDGVGNIIGAGRFGLLKATFGDVVLTTAAGTYGAALLWKVGLAPPRASYAIPPGCSNLMSNIF